MNQDTSNLLHCCSSSSSHHLLSELLKQPHDSSPCKHSCLITIHSPHGCVKQSNPLPCFKPPSSSPQYPNSIQTPHQGQGPSLTCLTLWCPKLFHRWCNPTPQWCWVYSLLSGVYYVPRILLSALYVLNHLIPPSWPYELKSISLCYWWRNWDTESLRKWQMGTRPQAPLSSTLPHILWLVEVMMQI